MSFIASRPQQMLRLVFALLAAAALAIGLWMDTTAKGPSTAPDPAAAQSSRD